MELNPVDPILSDRIQAIVATEKNIDDMMKCAREIMQDLGKEKQISKNKMDDNANSFKKLITQVENELSAQMQYLSHVCVGSSHQGSTFGVLQNSLLAQSGLSSLHSELAQILKNIEPPTQEVDEDNEDEEDSGDADMLEETPEDVVAPRTTSSSATTSDGGSGGADDAASSSAPRSQEERRSTEEEEGEQMEN
ncbi:hypothetical protein L5515_004295 [Caenorhabditis briggsae]|uniref:Mediator of RNA polymerase II transcription subunit 11 n=1 Tax=Caenorhabditis briggsae TaxID=6238 RepID=A0AAE9JBQ1_CAEBR|nr:hypothetical protein L5515_004295 [Caenorhabditis briggsae]